MTDQLFSPTRKEKNRARAMNMAKEASNDCFLLDDIAQSFADRLAFMNREFQQPVEYSHLPAIAPRLAINCPKSERMDDLPELCDLIIAPLVLDLAEDPLALLNRLRQKLAPDGMLLTACLGEQNLAQFRASLMDIEMALTGGAAARFHPRIAIQDLARLAVAAGFALPVADKDVIEVRYKNFSRLARDLRAHGLGNALTQIQPLRRDVVALANHQLFAPDSRPHTFEILHLAAFAPSPDQPKPKAPGSATTSLADALKAGEDQR